MLSLLAAILLLLAACASGAETTDNTSEAQEFISENEPESGSVEDETLPSEPAADTAAGDSIAALAQRTPELTTLVTALQAAGLTDALEQAGPLTVFAPNDEAFAQLDQADLTALLEDPTALGDILQYHVVEGSFPSSELSDGQRLTTLQGSDLTITIDGSTVMVNNAEVIQADIEAGNGVIHVINEVLTPEN
jgi:uncharacterized surface protein with fasciclin (FAS1) repeats